MMCPLCGTEMGIAASYQRVEGDESPDTPTKVFTVQEFACRNPACLGVGKTAAKKEHCIYTQE